MELPHLLWRTALEPDSASVGKGCRFAVDWLAYTEGTAIVPIEQAHLSGGVLIPKWLARSKNGQHCVIEALGTLNVVRSDHHVAKHPSVSLCTGIDAAQRPEAMLVGVLCGLTLASRDARQATKLAA